MSGYIIGFAGPLASGKTHAAGLLARYGFVHLRSRRIIEALLQVHNIPLSEQAMQDMGNRVVSTIGGDGLTALTLINYDRDHSYAYDSLRNVEDVQYLRRKYREAFRLVYLDVLEDRRRARFATRSGRANTSSDFEARSRHAVEAEIPELKRIADYAFTNESEEQLVANLADVLTAMREANT